MKKIVIGIEQRRRARADKYHTAAESAIPSFVPQQTITNDRLNQITGAHTFDYERSIKSNG